MQQLTRPLSSPLRGDFKEHLVILQAGILSNQVSASIRRRAEREHLSAPWLGSCLKCSVFPHLVVDLQEAFRATIVLALAVGVPVQSAVAGAILHPFLKAALGIAWGHLGLPPYQKPLVGGLNWYGKSRTKLVGESFQAPPRSSAYGPHPQDSPI